MLSDNQVQALPHPHHRLLTGINQTWNCHPYPYTAFKRKKKREMIEGWRDQEKYKSLAEKILFLGFIFD